MHRRLFLFAVFFVPLVSQGAPLVGRWTSDCQNVGGTSQSYLSRRPVDTFWADGRALLRVHVYEDKDCKGKEWDEQTLGCVYSVGSFVPGLRNTRELDLTCKVKNQMYQWYEIAEVTDHTLRFGNVTGSQPANRPKTLGSVYYRR